MSCMVSQKGHWSLTGSLKYFDGMLLHLEKQFATTNVGTS